MERLLADWYGENGIALAGIDLEQRSDAAESFLVEAPLSDVLEVVRMAYRQDDALHGPCAERLRDTIKAADATFLIRDNENELAVLASASSIRLLHDKGVRAAAVVLQCHTHRFEAHEPVIPELNEASLRSRQELATEVREQAVRPVPRTAQLSEDYRDALTTLEDLREESTINNETFNEAIAVVLGSQRDALKALRSVVSAIVKDVTGIVSAQSEELDILWWMFVGRSDQLNAPWSEVDAPIRPFVAAAELALRTSFVPGPVAARHFLKRLMGEASEELADLPALLGHGAEFLPDDVADTPAIYATLWKSDDGYGNHAIQRTYLDVAELAYDQLLLARLLSSS